VLAGHDLDTVEGRAAALRNASPIVADIRDSTVRPGYVRELARWLGMDLAEVSRAVAAAGRRGPAERSSTQHRPQAAGEPREPEAPAPKSVTLRDLPNDPATRLEREALMMIVQVPHLVGGDLIHRAIDAGFSNRALAAVRDSVKAQRDALGGAGWLDRLVAGVPPAIAPVVEELAFLQLPVRSDQEEQLTRTARSTVAALVDRHLLRQKADLVRQLQRTEGAADAERLRDLRRRLVGVEADRRMLRGA